MIRVHANEISEMFSVTFGDLNVRRMSDSSPVIFHLSMEEYEWDGNESDWYATKEMAGKYFLPISRCAPMQW